MSTPNEMIAKLERVGETVKAVSSDLVAFAENRPPAPSLLIDRYVLPVQGEPGEWYFADTHYPPAHFGLDINLRKAPRGDVELGYPILATCAGLVIFAGQARGRSWGNLIVTMSLDDDGPIYWRYGHAREVMVARGDYVGAGRQIGTIGKGYNDRYYAHLHLDCARGLQGPGEWGNRDVEWLDPLKVWAAAGYDWEWGKG